VRNAECGVRNGHWAWLLYSALQIPHPALLKPPCFESVRDVGRWGRKTKQGGMSAECGVWSAEWALGLAIVFRTPNSALRTPQAALL